MQDTQQNGQQQGEVQSVQSQRKATLRRSEKKTLAMKVFGLILKYKESALFQWVNRNYVLSLVIVTVWGMLIVGIFLFMVIYNIVKNSPH